MATKVNVNISPTTVLIGAGVVTLYFIYAKIRDAEVYNQPVVINTADYVFGAIDLLNPFAPEERKRYARTVYGLGD